MDKLGRGRPQIGLSRTVKITLPDDRWEHIDYLVASGKVASVAEYFRIVQDADDDRRREILIF